MNAPTIRSDASSGAARAAFDAATNTGYPFAGQRRIDDLDPAAEATKTTIRDATLTVILVPHPATLSPSAAFALAATKRYRVPYLILGYADPDTERTLVHVLRLLQPHESIAIAGPHEREVPGTYAACLALLTAVFSSAFLLANV